MDLENLRGFTLRDLGKINVLLGKNGCGKSYLLKALEQATNGQEGFGRIRYISPERGGFLRYQPGVEENITSNVNWLADTRRRNQTANFREQSTTLFRQLEIGVLRAIEREHTQVGYVPKNFDDIVALLNGLLDRVRLERDEVRVFRIVAMDDNAAADPEDISSGEAELISLGIEILAFAHGCVDGVTNLLLIDEPDVHLHPDLQDRLSRFMATALEDKPVTLILATHSTALLAGLADATDTCVSFMRRGDTDLRFKTVGDVDRAILPIFGAHPLSNVFNQAPALLVEGEDDERIWQQAVRSSQGRIRVYPCVVDGVAQFGEYETEVNNVISAVYDDAQAYSLRDRDLQPELIDDVGGVVRMRLACRAAENLLLSDDVLERNGVNWPQMQNRIRGWAEANAGHQYHLNVQAFVDGGFDRVGHDLKATRNILVGLISNKPWEILVGQAIAELAVNQAASDDEGALRTLLGEKLCGQVLRLN